VFPLYSINCTPGIQGTFVWCVNLTLTSWMFQGTQIAPTSAVYPLIKLNS